MGQENVEEMTIEKFTKRNLDQAVLFNAITEQRAISQRHNLACGDNDTCLIIARDSDKMIGYIGSFPTFTKIGIVHWLSTWWVDPETKGKGIGRMLFEEMYQAHDGMIGVSSYTESAGRIYYKSGYFKPLATREGFKYYLNPLVTKIIRPVDLIATLVIMPYTKYDFISHHKQYFEHLNGTPWIIEELNDNDKTYAFSDIDFNFHRYTYVVTDRKTKEYYGAFSAVLRSYGLFRKLTITHSYPAPKYADKIARAIETLIDWITPNILYCYDKEVNTHFHRTRYFIRRAINKKAIISNKFEIDRQYLYQYGIGDCAYT